MREFKSEPQKIFMRKEECKVNQPVIFFYDSKRISLKMFQCLKHTYHFSKFQYAELGSQVRLHMY